MSSLDILLGLIGVLLSVMVFSYMLGDNFIFRLAAYVLVGVSTGYAAVVLLLKVLIPYLIAPLQTPGTPAFYLSLVPLLLSILLAFMLIPKTTRAGKLPMAFLVGSLAAIGVAGVSRGTVAPQLLSMVSRFMPSLLQHTSQPDWPALVEATAIILGVITVLFYFHHRTAKKAADGSRGALVEGISSVGEVFIGITFGMLFVGFYSTALIALISRLTWIKEFLFGLFGL